MKKLSLFLLLAIVAGCKDDSVPHCARCFRKYPINKPGRDTSYLMCDKTYDEFRAYEQRENALYPYSQTDCVSRDTSKNK